jgi:hypothetical protein
MGVGSVGCCDHNTTLKNSEISVQSVTYREGSEDYLFSPTSLSVPHEGSDFKISDLLKRMKRLSKLTHFATLSLRIVTASTPDVLVVRPTGLVGSARHSMDGYVFFGCKFKEHGNLVNDVKIRLKETDKAKDLRGRFFVLYYKIESGSYWIRDLSRGPGVFIRLDFPLVLKEGNIVNIGNSFLSFHFKSKTISNQEVEIRKLGDDNYKV